MHHPQQASVSLECRNPLVTTKRPLIRRSSLPHLPQDLASGTLCDAHNPSNINLSAPFMGVLTMHCSISPEIRHDIVWILQNPDQEVVSTDRFWGNLTTFAPFSWPTTLASKKAAHLKLHEIYFRGNSLPKSIQVTSRNWSHLFRN